MVRWCLGVASVYTVLEESYGMGRTISSLMESAKLMLSSTGKAGWKYSRTKQSNRKWHSPVPCFPEKVPVNLCLSGTSPKLARISVLCMTQALLKPLNWDSMLVSSFMDCFPQPLGSCWCKLPWPSHPDVIDVLCISHRLGSPNRVLYPSLLMGDLQSHDILFYLWDATGRVAVLPDRTSTLPLLPISMWLFLNILSSRESILLIFR